MARFWIWTKTWFVAWTVYAIALVAGSARAQAALTGLFPSGVPYEEPVRAVIGALVGLSVFRSARLERFMERALRWLVPDSPRIATRTSDE